MIKTVDWSRVYRDLDRLDYNALLRRLIDLRRACEVLEEAKETAPLHERDDLVEMLGMAAYVRDEVSARVQTMDALRR